MKKTTVLLLAAMLLTCCTSESEVNAQTNDGQGATVYFTSDITAESLVKIYEALGVSPTATQRVGVKISTGESAQANYLRPDFIKPLVQKVGANIVECNTAYGGTRMSTASHRQQIAERGFNDVATVDIMDEEGTFNLPVADTKHLQYDIVGSHIQNYDFIINLAHFKGHSMGGFGGVLKNQSIGFASTTGKVYIHTAGSRTSGGIWYNNNQEAYQLAFLESMAAAAQAVHNYFKQEGRDIIYINVMNNLSVDCDCDGHPASPEMKDIGILASTDPVALDKACLDLVFNYNSTTSDNAVPLQNRINRQHGTHIVDYAEQIGLGMKSYQLISLDQSSSIDSTRSAGSLRYNVYSLDGKKLLTNAASLDGLAKGTYIINGQKTIIQ